MRAAADCIDDLDVVRSRGAKTPLDGIYAPSTIGIPLRESIFGHARKLESVLRKRLAALCQRAAPLAWRADQRAFLDIDSLLTPVTATAARISDAEIAETEYMVFGSTVTPVTAN